MIETKTEKEPRPAIEPWEVTETMRRSETQSWRGPGSKIESMAPIDTGEENETRSWREPGGTIEPRPKTATDTPSVLDTPRMKPYPQLVTQPICPAWLPAVLVSHESQAEAGVTFTNPKET